MGTRNPIIDLVGKFTTLVAMEMSIQCPVSEGSILVREGRTGEESEQEYAEILRNNGQKQIFVEDKDFYVQKKQCALVEAENNSDEKLVEYVSNVIQRIEKTVEEEH
jgi:hypothetical protein